LASKVTVMRDEEIKGTWGWSPTAGPGGTRVPARWPGGEADVGERVFVCGNRTDAPAGTPDVAPLLTAAVNQVSLPFGRVQA
jgi:hypothetical protein